MGWGYFEYRPYVSQAQRKAKAAAHAKKLEKNSGEPAIPVKAAGRTAAKSFWGQAWCDHIEKFSDYRNRLPRGMTYLRNGSVFDLKIKRGEIHALVSGSDIYKITITIKTLPQSTWNRLKSECSNSISSLFDLMQGKFNESVMRRLTDQRDGLLPKPAEISMRCSCPDSASLCKHLAAVMYGVGSRLDAAPELLFTLRDVDHLEMVGKDLDAGTLDQALTGETSPTLAGADLGELFGIELDGASAAPAVTEVATVVDAKPARSRRAAKAATKKSGEAQPKSQQKKSTASKQVEPAKAMRNSTARAAAPAATQKATSRKTNAKGGGRSFKK